VSQPPDPPIVATIRSELTKALSWAARAPNAESTWRKMRSEGENILTTHWRAGELLGKSTKQAFYIKCDRTTMTQNDLDAGRLVVEVGVAAIKPAEFVVFRIGMTSRHRRPR